MIVNIMFPRFIQYSSWHLLEFKLKKFCPKNDMFKLVIAVHLKRHISRNNHFGMKNSLSLQKYSWERHSVVLQREMPACVSLNFWEKKICEWMQTQLSRLYILMFIFAYLKLQCRHQWKDLYLHFYWLPIYIICQNKINACGNYDWYIFLRFGKNIQVIKMQ